MLQSGETGGSGFTASVFQSLAGLRLPLRQRETNMQFAQLLRRNL